MTASEPQALRLPNLLIAGVSKAGTTSLFHYLGQHPDVGTSNLKELRYFTPLRYGEPLQPVETYAAHFRHLTGERYALEATPGYFYGGARTARGIDATLPDVRVIVSLRDPAARCWSWYGFVKSRMRIPRDMGFDEYLDRCEALHREGLDGTVEHQAFWGLGGGCYDRWLEAWVDVFADRFRVVLFDDLAGRPRDVVDSLCHWLAVDDRPVASFSFEVDNRTVQYRHAGLQRVAVAVNRRGERFFHEHRNLKRALRRGYYAVNRDPGREAMSREARRRLDDFYGPHLDRLAQQLAPTGLTLPASWRRSS